MQACHTRFQNLHPRAEKLTYTSSLWFQPSRTAGDEARHDIWFHRSRSEYQSLCIHPMHIPESRIVLFALAGPTLAGQKPSSCKGISHAIFPQIKGPFSVRQQINSQQKCPVRVRPERPNRMFSVRASKSTRTNL
jgi:hypothetical protein